MECASQFQKLVNRNDDIRRLVDRGYAIAFDGPQMIVRDIPYLDAARALQWGAFVLKLIFVDDAKVLQDDHQIYFAGGVPHDMDGKPVKALGGGTCSLALIATKDVVVQRSFSNKPRDTGRFVDLFDKVENYVAHICGPAMNLRGATPLTFKVSTTEEVPSVFKFQDTLTSRAEITELSRSLEKDVIAVIGLGGTGAYVLDFLVKTPVREIRAFDGDLFHVHNTFRSPGRLMTSDLGRTKAEVYRERYENFRHGLSIHPRFVDAASEAYLEGVTFAFVCVDKGASRAEIFGLLMAMKIPFIDVGMGLKKSHSGPLSGLLRTTYFPAERAEQVRNAGYAATADPPDDIYRTNVQISELNALNAAVAVLRFKQLRNFYLEAVPYDSVLFDSSDLKCVGND
jgi:hypothetical protein